MADAPEPNAADRHSHDPNGSYVRKRSVIQKAGHLQYTGDIELGSPHPTACTGKTLVEAIGRGFGNNTATRLRTVCG